MMNICINCKNAVPSENGVYGCNWSRNFLPVEGWEAKCTKIKVTTISRGIEYKSEIDSYEIKSCPQFIPDRIEGNTKKVPIYTPVMCLTTGKRYRSLREAAVNIVAERKSQNYNAAIKGITYSILFSVPRLGGHWVRLDKY